MILKSEEKICLQHAAYVNNGWSITKAYVLT